MSCLVHFATSFMIDFCLLLFELSVAQMFDPTLITLQSLIYRLHLQHAQYQHSPSVHEFEVLDPHLNVSSPDGPIRPCPMEKSVLFA